MKYKFVDYCGIKIHVSGYDKLLESIFCSCWLWMDFSWKKLSRCLKCSWLARGQVNMVDEARLAKPWFCGLLSGVAVEESRAHSVGQCWLQELEFSVHLLSFLSMLTRCNGFAEMQEAVVGQMGSRPPNSDHDLFCSKFGFRQCLGASCQSSHWIACQWLSYKIHFLLHITIWLRNDSLLLYIRIKEDTQKWWHFHFAVTSWGIHLLSFFTFLICFKCRMTIEWLTLSPLATSCVVIRVLVSTILSIGRCWLLLAIRCAPHLQASRLLCKTSWTTTALNVC